MKGELRDHIGFIALLAVVAVVAIVAVLVKGVENGEDISVEITSRTEYIAGDEGQVITEVRYAISGLVAEADCYASAYYPNKATLFFEQPMVNTSHGTHYYNFTVPDVEGVYEYQTKCDLGTRNVTRSKAFHISGLFGGLQEEFAKIPKANFLAEGVSTVRLNKWNMNGWRIEGEGNITGAECIIHEGSLFSTELGLYSPVEFLSLALNGSNQQYACAAWDMNAYVGTNSDTGLNFEGLYLNDSQCPWTQGCKDIWWPDIGEIDVYIVPSATGGVPSDVYITKCPENSTIGAGYPCLGVKKWAELGYMSEEEFAATSCGVLNDEDIDWQYATGVSQSPVYTMKWHGNVLCIETTEGNLITKLRANDDDYVPMNFTGSFFPTQYFETTTYYNSCNAGAFVVNDDKFAGMMWYSDNQDFTYGNNYEVVCNVDYVLDNESLTFTGLRQSTYITNEGKLRAYVVK